MIPTNVIVETDCVASATPPMLKGTYINKAALLLIKANILFNGE